MLVMIRAAAELGFTPASQSRIEVELDSAEPDEWVEILGEPS